jgi:predicted kinase
VLSVGLPGSGKSTYFKQLGVNPISSDAIRLQLADDENDQTIHGMVFATVRYLLYQRIALKRPVTYLDATNLTPQERARWVKVAIDHNCEIEAIYFDVPLEVCKTRNAARHRIVPPEVMDQMAARLVPPDLKEGFSRVEVVEYLPEIPPVGLAG